MTWLSECGEGEQRGRIEVDQHTIGNEPGFGPLRFRDAALLLQERGLAIVRETAGSTGGRIKVMLQARGRRSGSSPTS
jgi:hypothetical protein